MLGITQAAEPVFMGAHAGGNAENATTQSTQFMMMQSLMKSSSTTSFTMFTHWRMDTKTAADDFWVYEKKTSPCTDKTNMLGVYDAVLCGKDGVLNLVFCIVLFYCR